MIETHRLKNVVIFIQTILELFLFQYILILSVGNKNIRAGQKHENIHTLV